MDRMGDLGTPDPIGLLNSALTGTLSDGGFVPSPPSARWLDPVSWKRHGLLATDTVLVIRRGRIWRQAIIVPHERTQALAVRQGPLQKLVGVGTFSAHSVMGPVKPNARYFEPEFLAEFLASQMVRSRQRRAAEGPAEWMVRVGISDNSDAISHNPWGAQSSTY